MTTITIGVATREQVNARFKAASRGIKQGYHYSFPTVELMHRVLTPNRLDILRAMMGAGPIGTRELARRLERDVKSIHTDLHALAGVGVIDRAEDKFVFPFDAIHVDFVLKAA